VAVPSNLYRVQYTFLLGTEGEVAVTGYTAHYAPGGDLDAAAQAVADHGYAAWIAGFVDHAGLFANSVVLDSCKAYAIVDSGPSPHIGVGLPDPDHDIPAWAGTNTTCLPWECALVATLEAAPAGTRPAHPRRYRGRMYLPPLGADRLSGTQGYVSPTDTTTLMNAVSDTLEYFNDTIGGTGPQARVHVLSREGGFSTPVDHVSMNNQMDLQKRRQNRQSQGERQQHAALDA